jgi:RNA polymerase sigma-70 factor (sigma-E family)
VEKPMSAGRDPEFTEYVGARIGWLRRIAFLLCQDWSHADDLVQAAITSLYVHWGRARAVEHTDAYARTILVRVFLSEQRSGWARRVSLSGWLPDRPGAATDHDAVLDLRDALARVPPRQRATLVLRFYSDLNVDQTAKVLGCSSGTVKSQTAKGLTALRRALEPAADRAANRES